MKWSTCDEILINSIANNSSIFGFSKISYDLQERQVVQYAISMKSKIWKTASNLLFIILQPTVSVDHI